jgi:ankyrin repeat protein
LEKGCDVNVVDSKGNTAVHFAKDLQMLELLDKYSTNFNVVNSEGETPLHMAMGSYNLQSDKLSVHSIESQIPRYGASLSDDEEEEEFEPVPVPVRRIIPTNRRIVPANRRIVSVVKKKVVAKRKLDAMDETGVKFLLGKGIDINAKTKKGLTALQIAAHGGNPGHLDVIKLLCTSGAKINEYSPYKSPIHIAMLNTKSDIVDVLVQLGADLYTFYDGTTVLHYAVHTKHKTLLSTLIDKQFPMGFRDEKGETAFGQFLVHQSEDDLDFLDVLIKSGVNLNEPVHLYKNYYEYPIHLAVCKGHMKVLEQLVKAGANLYQKDEYGDTIAHMAVKKAREDIVEYIYKTFAMDLTHTNIFGNTPLHLAADERHKCCLQTILASCHNSCINAQNKEGYTALHLAAMSYRLDIVEILVNNGADIHIRCNEGDSPLFVSTDKEISKYLIEKGVDIHTRFNDGCTLLFSANSIPLYTYYLSLGLDINAQDNDGYTVLHKELLNDANPDLIRFLVEHGANPNLKTDTGHTALHCVQDYSSLYLLCKHGADLNVQDSTHGCTPLHRFVRNGYTEFASILLVKRARVDLPDLDGKTALQYACLKGYTNLIQQMVKALYLSEKEEEFREEDYQLEAIEAKIEA